MIITKEDTMTKKLKIFDFVITALLVCAITVLIVMKAIELSD